MSSNQRRLESCDAIPLLTHCEPSELQVRRIQKPTIQDNEVLIEVHACGLNYADVLCRRGLYPDAPRYPFVPGYEVAGVIVSIGARAEQEGFDLKVGDKVIAFTLFGGYAEFAAARHEAVFALPDGMSFAEGASLPVNLVTAYHSLFFTGTLFPGDRVLIHAAAGGVGQIAVQMAKNAGCQVFVTASTEAKLSVLKDQFGADHTINYVTSNFAEEVRRILGVTDPKAGCLDVILDPVGGSQLKLDVDLLRPNGRVVSFGVAGLSDRSTVFGFLSAIPKVLSMLTFNAIDLLRYSKSFIGVNMLHIAKTRPDIVRHACLAGLELIKQGKVRTVVSKQLDWNLAGQAHQEMEERKTTGKIVFIVRPTGDAATATDNPSSVASSSAPQQTTASNPSTTPAAEASSSAAPVAPSDQ